MKGSTRWAVVLSGALLVAALVIVLVAAGRAGRSPKALGQELARAKAAGVPLQASDLARPVPASENATPLLRQAIASFDNLGGRGRKSLDVPEGQTVDLTGADQFFTAAKPTLEALRAAAKRPHCNFEHNLDNGVFELYPELAGIKRLARLAGYSAYAHAHRGDTSGALEDLRAGAALGPFAAEGGTDICTMVGLAVDRINLTWLERCAALANSEGDLKQYAELVDEGRMVLDMSRIVRSAAYDRIVMARNLHRFDPRGGWSSPPSNDNSPKDASDRATLISVLRAWTPLVGMAKGAGDSATTRAALRAAETSDVDDVFHGSKIYLLLGEPLYGRIYDAFENRQARLRCTAGMVIALIFRAKNGSLPDSLAEFAPELIDPYSGKPLGYLRTPKGFRIYSVGSDRVDDHGATRSEKKKDGEYGSETTYDLVAHFPPERALQPDR